MTSLATVKVSANSNPKAVAGSVAAFIRQNQEVDMYAIGPNAVNQAVKAVAIARGYLAPAGIDLVCVPAFAVVQVPNGEGGDTRTAIRIRVFPR